MSPVFVASLALLASTFQTRAAQQAEIVALRHQIAVLQRSSPRRLRLKQVDRLLWILLSRLKGRLTRVGMTLIGRSSSVRPEFSVMTGADAEIHSAVQPARGLSPSAAQPMSR